MTPKFKLDAWLEWERKRSCEDVRQDGALAGDDAGNDDEGLMPREPETDVRHRERVVLIKKAGD